MDKIFSSHAQATRVYLEHALQQRWAGLPQAAAALSDAVKHSLFAGGKAFRPVLVLEVARLYQVPASAALPVAAALECLHCYSLIHDDLPAMDNSPLRRGQPSCHVAYGEATAILAGDGLQALAFELIATADAISPALRCTLIARLAEAAGVMGMVGGQMLDIAMERAGISADAGIITTLQAMKTGALIRFACEAGALLGEANHDEHQALVRYGEAIGLLFQLADDILDANGGDIGKPTGQDQHKATFVQLLGLDGACAQRDKTLLAAQQHLSALPYDTCVLAELAVFVAQRQR